MNKTTIKKMIAETTGLTVTVLTFGYDSEKKLHYACCLYGVVLCYFEILNDATRIIICTDDEITLNNMSQILKNKLSDDQKNSNIATYNNVLYNSTNNTQYYMYQYLLRCDIT